MCLHLGVKWIISTIDSIADSVHHALAKIICSLAAMVHFCNTSIDTIYRVQTKSPTVIRKVVSWLWAQLMFTCPGNVREECWKFPSSSIVVLTMNLGLQVSICSDWNCGSYSPDILLWHTINGKERKIIDGYNQPDIHWPHLDGQPLSSAGLETQWVRGPATVSSRRWSTTSVQLKKYQSRI